MSNYSFHHLTRSVGRSVGSSRGAVAYLFDQVGFGGAARWWSGSALADPAPSDIHRMRNARSHFNMLPHFSNRTLGWNKDRTIWTRFMFEIAFIGDMCVRWMLTAIANVYSFPVTASYWGVGTACRAQNRRFMCNLQATTGRLLDHSPPDRPWWWSIVVGSFRVNTCSAFLPGISNTATKPTLMELVVWKRYVTREPQWKSYS